ncbi:MAG: hypothetical protein ACREEP_15035 [Dongiaceae bacterium]
MDPLILTIVMRSVERLLVVLAGALAIYLGFRLFLDMPSAERGSGKATLPGGVSIHLSRVGPGVFFSLFGAIVIGLSFQYGVSFKDSERQLVTAAAEEATNGERTWSGVAQAPAATVADVPMQPMVEPYERDRVVAVVAALNRFERALPANLPATDRINLQFALRDARERLLVSVWDPAWGDIAAFRAWISDNEPEPPPTPISDAARLYQAGSVAANP